ncbi:hypothetical protein IV203_037770 [Nitzschia inconspicua]|uniref:FPL domain-containing protein n=1 Tax=Nitzschia inconspicua TaxID=303405 RepID=A0A9K3LLK0_9STRA|nr:hypothetical protein IV203_037770 [Nitzschia inconspicua]
MMVGSLWLSSPKKRHSVERLRVVYTDLLQHIDADHSPHGLEPRRRASAEDIECHKKAHRFSFRRNIIPVVPSRANNGQRSNRSGSQESPTQSTVRDATDPLFDRDVHQDGNNGNEAVVESESRDVPNSGDNLIRRTALSVRNDQTFSDLAGAFRFLAASRSYNKDGEHFGGVETDEDGTVCGIQRAKALERRVVELIALIGDIVVNGSNCPVASNRTASSFMQSVRTDSVFEYFCEKCILSLLVDIAKEKRYTTITDCSHSMESVESPVHGVVWSGLVKAQVYETVSLLVSDVRNQSIIYYLLSNNYINDLIACMQPIQQWTEPAIATMLPAYVDLLKNLTLQLADDPHLFPFLTVETQDGATATVQFPLFSAALETASSYYTQSDAQIYATCFAIIINLLQIPHRPIQDWLNRSTLSQRVLSDHLCECLLNRFNRITYLTTGPVVDGPRHNAIASQLLNLKDHMGMVHEVVWSGVRGLDVRLCESLLQKVVLVLLQSLSSNRPFLVVGLVDADVIPESEALAQVSTTVFSYMFSNLAYVPLQRMLAVALLHTKSTPLWTSKNWMKQMESFDSYVFMPALSDIVNEEESRETCPNPFLEEILKTLQGDYGEWRTTSVACMLQSILSADAMDAESLTMLEIISASKNKSTSLQNAVKAFLTRPHPASAISAKALECVGILGLMILSKELMVAVLEAKEHATERLEQVVRDSVVWKAMVMARNKFYEKALEYRGLSGVSDLFLDLVEAAIRTRYTPKYSDSGSTTFTCLLNRRGHVDHALDADSLVREMKGVTSNDVETTRFLLNMSLQFRALCKVVDRLCLDIHRNVKTRSCKNPLDGIKLDWVDKADDLCRTVGDLQEKPNIGADLDLTGRTFFPFNSSTKSTQEAQKGSKASELPGEKLVGLEGVFLSTSNFVLVLDPTDLFVVKPRKKMEENRGTLLFALSLRSIIAAAADGEWLHIAVRNQDVGFLIKNGNMALKFESPGTCLIVKQYLDRSQEVLRQELLNKIPDLLVIPKSYASTNPDNRVEDNE